MSSPGLSGGSISALDIAPTLNTYGITKSSITLWGSGEPYREFIHVDDTAEACIFLMEKYTYEKIRPANISELEGK